MPYIEQSCRRKFDAALTHAAANIYEKEELTYCIYKLCVEALKGMDNNIANLTTIRSALLDAADEWFYEKILNHKKKERKLNGDII
jgi:hypothetical protein